MKLKRLAAATMGLMMVFAVPAYANDADAVAVYQEMNEKQKTLSDVNAYYDFNMSTKADSMQMNARLEMNMKANHITDPEHLRMNNYMRMTIGQFSTGEEGPAGEGVSMDLSGTPVTGNMYYENGMYYIDMMDQKIKQPMPLEQMMKSIQQIQGLDNGGLEYIQNLKLRTEGEDRILSYTMDAGKMNSLLDQVMGMSGMSAMAQSGAQVSYDAISGEFVVDPDGYCKKSRMKMGMTMTVADQTVRVTMDGDVGYADMGQPVEFATPDLNEYQLLETQ